MRRIILAVTLTCLAVPTLGQAQALVVMQNKCEMEHVGDLRAFADSAWIPIAQELVNEGKLINAGSAFHAWGDEWNVVYWYTADDISAFLSAWSELFSRAQERYPNGVALFQDWCFEHKDSMYSVGAVTTPPPPPSQGDR